MPRLAALNAYCASKFRLASHSDVAKKELHLWREASDRTVAALDSPEVATEASAISDAGTRGRKSAETSLVLCSRLPLPPRRLTMYKRQQTNPRLEPNSPKCRLRRVKHSCGSSTQRQSLLSRTGPHQSSSVLISAHQSSSVAVAEASSPALCVAPSVIISAHQSSSVAVAEASSPALCVAPGGQSVAETESAAPTAPTAPSMRVQSASSVSVNHEQGVAAAVQPRCLSMPVPVQQIEVPTSPATPAAANEGGAGAQRAGGVTFGADVAFEPSYDGRPAAAAAAASTESACGGDTQRDEAAASAVPPGSGPAGSRVGQVAFASRFLSRMRRKRFAAVHPRGDGGGGGHPDGEVDDSGAASRMLAVFSFMKRVKDSSFSREHHSTPSSSSSHSAHTVNPARKAHGAHGGGRHTIAGLAVEGAFMEPEELAERLTATELDPVQAALVRKAFRLLDSMSHMLGVLGPKQMEYFAHHMGKLPKDVAMAADEDNDVRNARARSYHLSGSSAPAPCPAVRSRCCLPPWPATDAEVARTRERAPATPQGYWSIEEFSKLCTTLIRQYGNDQFRVLVEGLLESYSHKNKLHRVYWEGWALWFDFVCLLCLPVLYTIALVVIFQYQGAIPMPITPGHLL